MLVKLVILAAVLYVVHIALEHYIVKDAKGGWAVTSALVWLMAAASTFGAIAYAVIGG